MFIAIPGLYGAALTVTAETWLRPQSRASRLPRGRCSLRRWWRSSSPATCGPRGRRVVRYLRRAENARRCRSPRSPRRALDRESGADRCMDRFNGGTQPRHLNPDEEARTALRGGYVCASTTHDRGLCHLANSSHWVVLQRHDVLNEVSSATSPASSTNHPRHRRAKSPATAARRAEALSLRCGGARRSVERARWLVWRT